MPKRPLTEDEKKFISENCLKMTDEAIARKLERDTRTIQNHRSKVLKIKKKNHGKIISVKDLPVTHTTIKTSKRTISVPTPGKNMSEADRVEFFKFQLTNSVYYETLREHLSDKEMVFYLEEWAALCIQFEDILATEKRQIDEFIKCQIFDNRVLKNIKRVETEIDDLSRRIEELRSKKDVQNDEEAQIEDEELMYMVQRMSASSAQMANDHKKFVELKNSILDQLNARRKDRVDQIARSKTSFIGLIEALQIKSNRENQGKYAELLRIAKEKKKDEWRSPSLYPDGSTDNILLDSETPDLNASNKAIKELIVEDHLKLTSDQVDKTSDLPLSKLPKEEDENAT